MSEKHPFNGELVKYCMVEYKWDESFAQMVVDEFFRFMMIKKATKDENAEIVSPSGYVDKVWHAALLYTKKYANYCEQEIGFFVHHDPNGAMDDDETNRIKRYKNTILVYKENFQDAPPILIWPEYAI